MVKSTSGPGRTKRPGLGIVAEDSTDTEALLQIVRRTLGHGFAVHKKAHGGCAKLERKLRADLVLFASQGVTHVLVVRDLDRDEENVVRRALEKVAVPNGVVAMHICIPIEELEAWFWADDKLVKKVGRGNGAAAPTPSLVKSPKEELMKLSRCDGGKARYDTTCNKDLARDLSFADCEYRCREFREMLEFLRSIEHVFASTSEVAT